MIDWEANLSTAFKVGRWVKEHWRQIFPLKIEEIKKRAQVLIIDDELQDPIVRAIQQAGWNVRQVHDVDNLDDSVVKQADIIFVDYKNVGMALTPTEEGIGLLKTLKRKYPRKHFIFFSGYAGFIPGHMIHEDADSWIAKNSDHYIYIEHIEQAATRIYGGK